MKNTKTNKQGVSLIVLVITIIVMIILAGTIILSLDNNGIIGKAQEAVNKTNLAEVQNLAQLAWAEAYLNNERTDEKLKAAVEAALAAQEITEADYPGYTMEVSTSGVKFVKIPGPNPALNHSGIIPQGAKYITGGFWDEEGYEWNASNTTTYNAGEAFPDEVHDGDVYIYGDYEYIYNYKYSSVGGEYSYQSHQNGWGVKLNDWSVETPGELLETINTKPLVSVATLFQTSTITTAPAIPKTVLYMDQVFGECNKLRGTIVINANPTSYENWLYIDGYSGESESVIITLTGTSTMLEQLAEDAVVSEGNINVQK